MTTWPRCTGPLNPNAAEKQVAWPPVEATTKPKNGAASIRLSATTSTDSSRLPEILT